MVGDQHFCIAYIIVDALCFVITVIMASNLSRNSGSEMQVRYFNLLLMANLVFVTFDAVWAYLVFGGQVKPSELLLTVVNGINVCSLCFASYFWLCFIMARFTHPFINERKNRVLAMVPALLAPVLHAVGASIGQNVVFAPTGIEYGFVHTIISGIILFYLFAATVAAIWQYRRTDSVFEKRTCLVFISFMVAPTAAGLFDMAIPDMPIAAAGTIISIIFVMMSLQNSRISSDALTGLGNRRSAEEYLMEELRNASPESPLYFFIADLNSFKSVNDTYGHLEGDRALKIMGSALGRVAQAHGGLAARWGGDEFILICADGGDIDPDQISREIEDALSEEAKARDLKYTLNCCVGYSSSDSASKTYSEVVSAADDMLYRKKRALK